MLLCGSVPDYRDLRSDDVGNASVSSTRTCTRSATTPRPGRLTADDNAFTTKTERALMVLQQDKGFAVTGRLDWDPPVFQPDSLQIARLGG